MDEDDVKAKAGGNPEDEDYDEEEFEDENGVADEGDILDGGY
jgi:hypothetical protein